MKHFRVKKTAACGTDSKTLRLTTRLHLVDCKRCRASAQFKGAVRRAEIDAMPDDSWLEELGRMAGDAADAETAAEYEADEADEAD